MGKKTYQRVVDLLNEYIPAKISRNQFSKITGINRNSIDRYRVGLGNPIHETLEKMADYFGVPVEWLQGKGDLSYEEVSDILNGRGLGVPIVKAYEIAEVVMEVFSRRGIQLPAADSPERAIYIEEIKSNVVRECNIFILQMRGVIAADLERVLDRILGVDTEEHRASQTRYIVAAAKMATDEELDLLAEQAGVIIGKHCS